MVFFMPFPKDPGLLAFGFAQVIFVLLPFLDRSPNVAPANRRGIFKIWFWVLLCTMVLLTVLGKLPPVGIATTFGTITASFFILLWLSLPIVTSFEKPIGGK